MSPGSGSWVRDRAGQFAGSFDAPGNPYLKGAPGFAALSAARSMDTYNPDRTSSAPSTRSKAGPP
jgi:hypothetical protein